MKFFRHVRITQKRQHIRRWGWRLWQFGYKDRHWIHKVNSDSKKCFKTSVFSPYTNNVDANFESVVEISDHSAQPFKQYTRYHPDQKITEIKVEAHNDYEQNTFFLLHEHQLRVAVIGNHTCIFSDIHAYDIDSVPKST